MNSESSSEIVELFWLQEQEESFLVMVKLHTEQLGNTMIGDFNLRELQLLLLLK